MVIKFFSSLIAENILEFLAIPKGGLTLFPRVTASITMLFGGFVLANFFSISVSERAEEIGLKEVLGARSFSIMLQFLAAACALTLIGGLLGLV